MLRIRIKAILVGKSLITGPMGENLVKLELVEERSAPGPIIASQQSQNPLMREIMPIVSQVVKSMTPNAKIRIPRLTLFLYEDEWERLVKKPDIGDEVEITVENEKINIKNS